MSNIRLPIQAIEKLASFMERVPQMVSAITSTDAPAPIVNRKEAEARTVDLVKHAGLDPARQGDFTNFILTNEGALKTLGSLTTKIASLQADIAQARNLAVGAPASASYKSAATSGSQSSSAWCEALLR